MIRSYEHVHEDDTAAVLTLGARLIDDSGIITGLADAAGPTSNRGRRPSLKPYDARAVLVATFELAYSARLVSVTNLLDALWFRYTAEEMELIGMSDWRDEDRAARMRADDSVHRNEYVRLSTFFTDLLRPMDDTPVTAGKRLTNREYGAATAETPPELLQRRALRDRLMNRLVAASVDPGLMVNYRGHLAVDEHNVTIALYDAPTGVQPDAVRGGNAMGGFSAKHRRNRNGWTVGASCGVSISQPGQAPVPRVCLGVGFDRPSAASIDAALTIVDEAEANGLIPKLPATQHKWFIGDKAYNNRDGFNASLLERGWTMLMDYPKHLGTVHELWQDGESDGPRLVNGVVVCPGIPGRVVRGLDLRPLPDNASPAQIHRRELDLRRVQAATMPTNGRPVRSLDRGRGRPSKNANDLPVVYKQKVQCPAESGKIRCPLVKESLDLDPATFELASPPAHPPTCCRQFNSHVAMDERTFKQHSALMVGSFEHDDFFRHARSHNENYFARLSSKTGGNLHERSVVQRRNSGVSLVITLAVVATNIKEQAAWRQAIRRNDGHVPIGARARRAATRRRTIRALDRKPSVTEN